MRIINYLSCIVLFLAFIFLCLFAYWSLYPYKPIVFNNIPFPVDHGIYAPGDVLVYKVDYCKYTDLIPIVTRYYVNSVINFVSSNPAIYKPKGCAVTNVQLTIPNSLYPDVYYLRINYIYQVNPIRTINVSATTSAFIITK